MRKLMILPALALAAITAMAGAAAAGDDVRADAPHQRDRWMSVQQVTDMLTSQGYTVRDVEIDDGLFEIEARDRDGKWIEAKIHPVSGEVLHKKLDD